MSNDISTSFTKEQNIKCGRTGYAGYGMFLQSLKNKKKKNRY